MQACIGYSEPPLSNNSSLLKQYNIFKLCYLGAFFCYGIGYELSITNFASRFPQESAAVNQTLQIVALLLLVLKVLVQRYDVKRMLTVILLSAPLLLGSLSSDNYSTLWLVIFAISAQGITLRDIARAGFVTTSIMIVGTILLALLGVLDNTVLFRSDGTVRFALGFAHPNSLGVCILHACICLFVLGFGQMGLAHYAFMVIAMLICNFVCDSRTETLAVVLILVCSVMSTKDYFQRRNGLVCMIAFVATLTAAALSLYFMVNYNSANAVHSAINDMLSYRLDYAHYYYEMFPPSLFGQAASLSGFSPVPLDNSWSRELEAHGVISIVYMLLIAVCIYLKSRNSQRTGALPYVMLIYAFVSVSETIAFHIFFNISLITITTTFFGTPIGSFDDSIPGVSLRACAQERP